MRKYKKKTERLQSHIDIVNKKIFLSLTKTRKEKPNIIIKERFVIAQALYLLLYETHFVVSFVRQCYFCFAKNLTVSFAMSKT